MQITEMIEAIQQALNVQVDGKAGSETWGAIYAKIVLTAGGDQTVEISEVDERSERHIATLLPEVRPIARTLVQKAAGQ